VLTSVCKVHSLTTSADAARHAIIYILISGGARTLAPARLAMSAVPSVLPPSTTSTSSGGLAQLNTLRSVSLMLLASHWGVDQTWVRGVDYGSQKRRLQTWRRLTISHPPFSASNPQLTREGMTTLHDVSPLLLGAIGCASDARAGLARLYSIW